MYNIITTCIELIKSNQRPSGLLHNRQQRTKRKDTTVISKGSECRAQRAVKTRKADFNKVGFYSQTHGLHLMGLWLTGSWLH